MEKSLIRKQILDKRNCLTYEQISLSGTIALQKIVNEDAWKQSDVVYLYSSIGSEVSTKELLRECFRRKKRVAFPRVTSKGVMEFFEVLDKKELHCGFQGILEPNEECKQMKEAGVILVPGVAFDRENYRIGYGGGYYDRYFSTHKEISLIKLGLAYSFQILPMIEHKSYDEPVDKVITIFLSS